jgi:hypothetical protein
VVGITQPSMVPIRRRTRSPIESITWAKSAPITPGTGETERADADPSGARFRQAPADETRQSAPTCRLGSTQVQQIGARFPKMLLQKLEGLRAEV